MTELEFIILLIKAISVFKIILWIILCLWIIINIIQAIINTQEEIEEWSNNSY